MTRVSLPVAACRVPPASWQTCSTWSTFAVSSRLSGVDARAYPQPPGDNGPLPPHLRRYPIPYCHARYRKPFLPLTDLDGAEAVLSYYSYVAYWTGFLTQQSADVYRHKRTDCSIYLEKLEGATKPLISTLISLSIGLSNSLPARNLLRFSQNRSTSRSFRFGEPSAV